MLAPPLSEGGRAGGAHTGTGRVPPTLVRRFCNVRAPGMFPLPGATSQPRQCPAVSQAKA